MYCCPIVTKHFEFLFPPNFRVFRFLDVDSTVEPHPDYVFAICDLHSFTTFGFFVGTFCLAKWFTHDIHSVWLRHITSFYGKVIRRTTPKTDRLVVKVCIKFTQNFPVVNFQRNYIIILYFILIASKKCSHALNRMFHFVFILFFKSSSIGLLHSDMKHLDAI